jgi:hypothetical protein
MVLDLAARLGREIDRHKLAGAGIEDRHRESLSSGGVGETPDHHEGSNRVGNVVSNSLPATVI